MMKNITLATILILTILSCSKETPEAYKRTIQNSPLPSMNGFDDMQVGDEYNYVYFLGESYYDPDNGNYEFTKDTLNFEVCGIRDGKFIVSERLTPGSEKLINEETDYWLPYADSIFTYYMFIRNDSLVTEAYEDESYISHLYNGTPLDLRLEPFTENEVDILGWKTTYPYHEYIAETFCNNADITGNIFPYLNIYMYNLAMALDGDGKSYFYSKESGMVRTARYSWWTSMARGWELILE